MAILSITIPDAVVVRVRDAVAVVYGYLDPETGQPRVPGQTKTQFTQEVMRKFIKDIVKQYEAQAASETARLSAVTAVDQEITLS